MTDKELKTLRRSELLEMLIIQGKENERLRSELDAARQQKIEIQNSGSIAEAALKISGMFEAADAAVRAYQEAALRGEEGMRADYDKLIFEAKQKAEDIVKNAEKKAELIEENAKQRAERILQQAVSERNRSKFPSNARMNNLSMDEFYAFMGEAEDDE